MNVGVDPSKVVITKLKIDKDRKARRRPGAALAQPEIAAYAARQPLLRRMTAPGAGTALDAPARRAAQPWLVACAGLAICGNLNVSLL